MIDTNLITTMGVTFRITRLIQDRLYPSVGDLTLELDFAEGMRSEFQRDRLNLMRNWINEILDGCIAFSVQSDLNTELFGQVSNHVMFCPDDPHDHLLLMLIAAKLNAIGMGAVTVRVATLAMDTSGGLGNTLIGDPADMLPDGKEWMGDPRYWNEPWWNRPDGGMMDIPVGAEDDPDVKPDILIDMDTVSATKIRLTTDDADSDGEPAEIIRPNFKPRIITKETE